ncbi:ATP-binding cassette domain-containing protein [Schnuerera sp. xch1]|uniref:ATP-binding cassette domain-containing protein n=1 Tax=Schnuerera sp. xch1 TaxID=2874283 RepID=UPI0021D839AE|nr:ATP-binding cassette domain-containing protein [Schnuerera sp. xch1]
MDRENSYILELKGICKSFLSTNDSHGVTIALEDIDLSIRDGEFISIVGPSGCGKSTILRLISRVNFSN